jgi:UDP-N-acetylmuramate dehydrogenase
MMPHYDEPNGRVKVSAGWLIEHSGPSTLRLASGTAGSGTSGAISWKGWRNEHVGVYEKQALVLVHYGSEKGQDIVQLAQRIQDSVEKKFGIRISPEVNFV